MHNILFIVVFCLAFAPSAGAQAFWELYNTDNSGLPDNLVNALAAGSDDRLWVGTETGLALLQAGSWTNFTSATSGLPDNAVRSLAVEPGGEALWVGTFLGGLARYDGSVWQVWNTANSPLPENFIRDIWVEHEGRVWLGTPAGLALKEGDTWTVWNTSNSDLPGNNVPSVHLDPDGTPWVGTINSGIARFNGKGWENWTIANSDLVDNTILDIARDTAGNLWLATPAGGLIIMTPEADFLTFNTLTSDIPDNEIARIAFDPWQRGLLGMTAAGLVQIDGTTWTVYDSLSTGLPDNRVRALLVAPDSSVWVGMFQGGLAHWQPEDTVSGLPHAQFPAWLNVYPNPIRAGQLLHWQQPGSGAFFPGEGLLYNEQGLCLVRSRLQPGEPFPVPVDLAPGTYVFALRSANRTLRTLLVLLPG
jgi:ligand-binding sensor domain-containing protein